VFFVCLTVVSVKIDTLEPTATSMCARLTSIVAAVLPDFPSLNAVATGKIIATQAQAREFRPLTAPILCELFFVLTHTYCI
jgi:hypothetical protein